MTNWYAVYTRPNYERKTVECFIKKNIEAYCPVISDPRRSQAKKKSQVVLFPTYIFVRVNKTQAQNLKNIEGVINNLFWLNAPVIVRDIEIEMIKRFLEEHAYVHTENVPVDPKAIVSITKEVQKETGKGIASENRRIIKLLLPTLGRALVANTREEVVLVSNFAKDQNFQVSA